MLTADPNGISNFVSLRHKQHSAYPLQDNQLMMFRKLIVVYWIIIHGAWIHRVGKLQSCLALHWLVREIIIGF